MNNRKNLFFKEIGNLIFFWVFGVSFFLIFRLIFILIFRNQIVADIDFSDGVNVLIMGFRFDTTVVSYFIIIPLILSFLLLAFDISKMVSIIRKISQILFVIFSVLLCVVTINYFKEYNDQFNNFLFLALYDDQKAVTKTIIKDFNPILNSFIILSSIILGILIFRYFENKSRIYAVLTKINFKYSTTIMVLLISGLFFGSIRGSFGEIPTTRKWAGVSKDFFLNKTIINPYHSLKYAIKDFNELNPMNDINPYLTEGNTLYEEYGSPSVVSLITKTAKGATIEKPKQIFLVIMESYDAWPLMEKYKSFGVSDNLYNIAQKGTHFTHFLPAANSTFDSFASITMGIPNCGVNVSHLGAINEPFITSVFTQFKELGYQTNFFYGGFLSWQNIGDFTTYQGVDRVFSGVDAGGKSDSGDWGVEDEKLFDLVLKNVEPNTYSLNVILTSSYHAPFTIDFQTKGFPYKSEKDLPEEAKKYFNNGMTIKHLGHLWYSDKAIGDFVKEAEEKFGNGLYCFTGDHYGRRFINPNPNLYEKSAVPFILYGNSVPKSKNTNTGGHVDIIPTLIEMIAPEGFEYYTFGTSMFEENKNSYFAFNKIILNDTLYSFSKQTPTEAINLNTFQEIKTINSDFRVNYDRYMALAWHYTMKGDTISESKKISNKK
ncbi:MAG: sulfatase-like hydrolase/transferase [Weeksellaceae bacterium]|nr:sulfatase-like hydrolase/transferase [Weeksellaceae bacterium]